MKTFGGLPNLRHATSSASAPVALFAYRRPEHTARMLRSLAACAGYGETVVFAFCDGPRAESERTAVLATRRLVRAALRPIDVLVESPTNRGLATSIIDGVTRVCAEHGRVIVIEDDLVLDPRFLRFMNAALDVFADAEAVMQVSGYMFPVPRLALGRDVVLLPFTSSWGWATWQRAWQHFDASATGWEELAADPSLRRRFDVDGAFPYSAMLEEQMAGRGRSWAIRWYWSTFRRSGLAAYPPRSLVTNIGFDGSGTNGWLAARLAYGRRAWRTSDTEGPALEDLRGPRETVVDAEVLDAVRAVIGRTQRGPIAWARRLASALRSR